MKSISWLLLLLLFFFFFKESKKDRQRHLDPKLLFPVKAWLQGFLPGHQFSWEEEDSNYSYDLKVKFIRINHSLSVNFNSMN